MRVSASSRRSPTARRGRFSPLTFRKRATSTRERPAAPAHTRCASPWSFTRAQDWRRGVCGASHVGYVGRLTLGCQGMGEKWLEDAGGFAAAAASAGMELGLIAVAYLDNYDWTYPWCVCVCEREREREKESIRTHKRTHTHTHTHARTHTHTHT